MNEFDELLKQKDEQDNKKRWASAIGSAFDQLVSAPSAAEIAMGQKRARSNIGEKLSQFADKGDPIEKREKAMKYMQMKRENQKGADEEARLAALKDPNSTASKAFMYSLNRLGVPIPDGATAFDMMQMGYSPAELAKIDAQNRADIRKFQIQKAIEANEKKNEVDKTKIKNDREYDQRRKDIETNLAELNKLVNEYGTAEVLNPGVESRMRQLVDAIAIDSAKMFDPESVARPSEVDNFKRMLFEPGTVFMRDATAKEGLKGFQDMIARRTANRYGTGPEQKTIVKRQINKRTGATRLVYSDGSTEVLPAEGMAQK